MFLNFTSKVLFVMYKSKSLLHLYLNNCKSWLDSSTFLQQFCLLYICKIVFGQVYAPGQVTYYDPHCSNMVKWSIIIVWPLPTLHYHTCLPGHTATVDDYKYMDGHNNHCDSGSDKRNSTFITLFDQDFNFRKLPTDLWKIPLEKSMFKVRHYLLYSVSL